jgi:hypothetical protein
MIETNAALNDSFRQQGKLVGCIQPILQMKSY